MKDLVKMIGVFLIGMAIATIIGLGVWLNWRISVVETQTAQIVNFLNQKQVQPAQVNPK